MVFSTFYIGQLEKTCWHHWKEHLNISKIISKLESDNIFSEQRYNSAKFQKFTDVCMVGCKFVPPTIEKSVKFCDFEELFLH